MQMNPQERFEYALKRRFPDLTAAQVQALIDAGLTSPKLVNAADDEQLEAVKGIGPVTVSKIRGVG